MPGVACAFCVLHGEGLPHVYTLSPPQTLFAGIVDNDDKAITNLGGIETIAKVSSSVI